MIPVDTLALVDFRRSVAESYARVRAAASPREAWLEWTRARDDLFRAHPESAIEADARASFRGLRYWPYDSAYRAVGTLVGAEARRFDIRHSDTGSTRFVRVGRLDFELGSQSHGLDAFWLDAYGGGVFVPFGDATNGVETYGGGRYLLDTVKGADLGGTGPQVVLDFNFAYHPSCVYSARWSCPLPPPGNRLSVPIPAGERLGEPTDGDD